jgi:hypothetical protein
MDEFKEAFKDEIKVNKKVKMMLRNIQDEQRLQNHTSEVILDMEEFKYIYLFLDWDEKNKAKKKAKEAKKAEKAKAELAKDFEKIKQDEAVTRSKSVVAKPIKTKSSFKKF